MSTFCLAMRDALLKIDSYSVTTDAWSSGSLSCVAITIHYVETGGADWKMQKACLQVSKFNGSHSAEALAEYVEKAVDNIHMQQPITVKNSMKKRMWAAVADGAAAQQKSFHCLGEEFNIWKFWCI